MPGLVIDSSSPATHTTADASPTNTCAAFSPPADALLLALWSADSRITTDPGAPSISSSPSLTWTQDVWESVLSGTPLEDGQAGIWHVSTVGAVGSTTVSVVNGAQTPGRGAALSVLVLTGADPTTPVGETGGFRQADGSSISQSYIGTISGGQGFMVVSDWNAGDTSTWAADTGCTIIAKGTISGEISYAILSRTAADGIIGGSTSLGVTGLPAGGQYHWAYAEVISSEAVVAAAASAGYPAFGASPPMF